jgi:alkylation response protein AidB-like acyl-CoA dehydrogenase
VPTAIATAVLAAVSDDATRETWLPRLASGSATAGLAYGRDATRYEGKAASTVGAVLCGGDPDLVVLISGEDLHLLDTASDSVRFEQHPNLDPTRRSVAVILDAPPVAAIEGAGPLARSLARVVMSAEAVGVARECTERAADYAKVREQFGRPIGTFQAVKHHCANMAVATELATAAVWDAARAVGDGPESLEYAAAVAAALAGPAAVFCANLHMQVHGGIGFTWEHDAHLFLRRATVVQSFLDPDQAAADLTALTHRGVRRARSVDLPPEAEDFRPAVSGFVASIADADPDAQRAAMVETGYAVPHWPKPWGRDAGPIEQLVIEQEFGDAGLARPQYGITGWVILTLIQHGTPDQVARWVPPALAQDVIWCQLFSEPDAGSDAAGITTRATRVDGGFRVSGQKVWTSGAHVAGQGFITVRTDPDAPKHRGITTMVVDMKAPGVEIRPLRMPSGGAEFNEVFLDDVFVPDDDVVGPINGGWSVARATLGNESVSIGSGEGQVRVPSESLVAAFDAHRERLPGGASRVGTLVARQQAMVLLNLRNVHRAVAGSGPGPEGAITKLVLSENAHEAAAILAALAGTDVAFLDGDGAAAGTMTLMHRAMSIAGGTSEIKRNQIGERILGLPRDPLVR